MCVCVCVCVCVCKMLDTFRLLRTGFGPDLMLLLSELFLDLLLLRDPALSLLPTEDLRGRVPSFGMGCGSASVPVAARST